MKKLLNALDIFVRVLLIVFAFSVASSFAEVGLKHDTASRAVDEIQSSLSRTFTYCDVSYDEDLDRIYVRVALDGLSDIVNQLIEDGCDETHEGWANYRDSIIVMYDTLLEYVHAHYRDDLTITFHLVNENDTARDFISINGGTKSVFDILKF